MRIQFCGAARQVTGSMHWLQHPKGYNILVDCGLSYEPSEEWEDNARFPFLAEEIDVVLLTHAHMDHSGNIPTLIRQGFRGQIFSTEPTADLMAGLLADSANIQLSKSKKGKGRRHKSRNQTPLYGHKEVKEALERVITLSFDQWFELTDEIRFRFLPAGHILGAASIELEYLEQEEWKRIGFTGDLGKKDNVLIVPPQPMSRLHTLICESTYGNREHSEKRAPEEVLFEFIEQACIKQKGKLIIPAFSVGRTQAILFVLHKLQIEGKLADIRVFADSPLGIFSTQMHERHASYLNRESRSFLEERGGLFEFKNLYVIEDEDDKLMMSFYNKPCIIVSSAGMMEGGRIQEHVGDNLQNPFCTILAAGYCTPGTLGADLINGKKRVNIKGREKEVYANIESMDAFSAHPGASELVAYVEEVLAKSPDLKQVFLVHGDENNIEGFSEKLSEKGIHTNIPTAMQSVEL
jgi:metallo-beta-lactamase family protein